MINCRNYNRNHFFCLRFVFTIFYTEVSEVIPEKNHPHLKSQFPPKIPIWAKSLLYKRSGKWLSPPSHHPGGCSKKCVSCLWLPLFFRIILGFHSILSCFKPLWSYIKFCGRLRMPPFSSFRDPAALYFVCFANTLLICACSFTWQCQKAIFDL